MASNAPPTLMQFTSELIETTVSSLTVAYREVDDTITRWEKELVDACKDAGARFAPSIHTDDKDQQTIDTMKAVRGQLRSTLKEMLVREHLG